MPHATLQAVHPVLPSRNMKAAIAYYVHHLGFVLLFKDEPANLRYAAVQRDNVELHLQWHDSAEWAAAERPMLRFVVPVIHELFKEYQPMGVFHDHTVLRETPWGTREFAFYDLNGNGLTFYCDL